MTNGCTLPYMLGNLRPRPLDRTGRTGHLALHAGWIVALEQFARPPFAVAFVSLREPANGKVEASREQTRSANRQTVFPAANYKTILAIKSVSDSSWRGLVHIRSAFPDLMNKTSHVKPVLTQPGVERPACKGRGINRINR
jgi:hypothetical protein